MWLLRAGLDVGASERRCFAETMAAMLSMVRSWRVARRSGSAVSGSGSGGGGEGRGGGDSSIGGKEVARAMDMRVRSTKERRGWGFFTGEGVASPIEEIICSAMASSCVSVGGMRTGGSEG